MERRKTSCHAPAVTVAVALAGTQRSENRGATHASGRSDMSAQHRDTELLTCLLLLAAVIRENHDSTTRGSRSRKEFTRLGAFGADGAGESDRLRSG